MAGLAAVQAAKNMGAVVKAFDVRPAVKEQIESLGGEFLEVDVNVSSSRVQCTSFFVLWCFSFCVCQRCGTRLVFCRLVHGASSFFGDGFRSF